MDESAAETFRGVIRATRTASLGTVGPDGPLVSMVPVAIDGSRILIHVSGLAAHTEHLRVNSRVSVMLMAPQREGASVLSLPRISFSAEAHEIDRDSDEHDQAREIYVRRIPEGEMLFGFGDFALFALQIQGARFVAGFGAAMNVSTEEIVEVVRGLE